MRGGQRVCTKCQILKPIEDFYKHPSSDGGRDTRCKECVKEMARANRAAKAEFYRAYDRKRYRDDPDRKARCQEMGKRPEYAATKAEAVARSMAEEPEKWKARRAVAYAIKAGNLDRGAECYFCGSDKNIHAHHEDYNHPLDVVWLCSSCHGKLHTIKGDFRRAS